MKKIGRPRNTTETQDIRIQFYVSKTQKKILDSKNKLEKTISSFVKENLAIALKDPRLKK